MPPLSPFVKRPRRTVHETPPRSSLGREAVLGAAGSGSGSGLGEQPGPSFTTPTRGPPSAYAHIRTGSPFASYSPSSPLSRSAILPFDREGSERAAARAVLRRSESGGSASGPQGTPTRTTGAGAGAGTGTSAGSPRRRKAIIRRPSAWERLRSLPRRTIDYLEPDAYTPPPGWARYIALALHVLHAGVCLGVGARSVGQGKGKGKSIFKEERGVMDPLARYEAGRVERGQSWASWTLFICLMALSLGNALYLFQSTRRYDMMHRSKPLDSPHAKSVPAPRRQDAGDDAANERTTPQKLVQMALTHLNPIPLIRLLLGQPSGQRAAPSPATQMMQTLHVWDPPEFNAEFFIFYSPFLPPVIQFFAASQPRATLFFLALLVGQTRFIISSFEQLVKDRMLLQREVMREYDETFVYKRIYSTRMDKSVQTSEAEMI